MANADLTAQRLREYLHYDHQTGAMTRLIKVGRRHKPGPITGCISEYGYLRVRVDKRLYLAHRLAWLWMTGEWPTVFIDHIDGNRLNNVWSNLREATNALNMQNVKGARADSQLGILGVSICKRNGTFKAQIGYEGKTHFLGRFKTSEEASAAYMEAKRKYHPGNTL
jgi:HNH endonuclease